MKFLPNYCKWLSVVSNFLKLLVRGNITFKGVLFFLFLTTHRLDLLWRWSWISLQISLESLAECHSSQWGSMRCKWLSISPNHTPDLTRIACRMSLESVFLPNDEACRTMTFRQYQLRKIEESFTSVLAYCDIFLKWELNRQEATFHQARTQAGREMFLLARHESQELDKKERDNSEDKPQLNRGRVRGQGWGQGRGQDRRGGRDDCAACRLLPASLFSRRPKKPSAHHKQTEHLSDPLLLIFRIILNLLVDVPSMSKP